MLFSKVAATLAAAPNASFLIGMAAAALTQIAVGAAWGKLLSSFVDGREFRELSVFGWQPFSPGGRPAAAIASATAAATGLPQAAVALLPRPAPPPPGLKELITAACAFGNSFTLPAVFFLSLLPGALAGQAIAYAGLFLLAWSPCLWSFGLNTVENGFLRDQKLAISKQQTTAVSVQSDSGSSGSGSGTIDVSSTEVLAEGQEDKIAQLMTALRRFASRTLNPPVLAILTGALVGMSPTGKLLIAALKHGPGTAAAAGGGGLPVELALAWAAVKGAYEVIEMLAAGTLATQTLVLASSLLQQSAPSSDATRHIPALNGRSRGWFRDAWAALAPADAIEARALAVLSLVRFVLVPTTCLFIWQCVASTPFGAVLAADPLFLFVIAVQAVMPSAQNLIIVLQLSDATRPAAPAFAKLLLKLYAYAVLPVTLWVTAFASRLSIPLV